MRRIPIAHANAAAALEAMSRFAIAPQWLIYLPPTMSPVETSKLEGWLERPEEAFAFYRERGQSALLLEEKHMGSRGIIAVCRDDLVARRRFGAQTSETGAIWTRTGRPFFTDRAMTAAILERLRRADRFPPACGTSSTTDWLLLDAEIMPWSAKASSLIEQQYEPVAVSGRAGLAAAVDAASRATTRGAPLQAFTAKLAQRRDKVDLYARAWRPYAWPVNSVGDLKIAPFHLLASEGVVHFDKDHLWHLAMAARLVEMGGPAFARTRALELNLDDPARCAEAIAWWEELTALGGEGMVVKPLSFAPRGAKGLLQPALKVRGAEYLRIIYGPEYDLPENLNRLRERGLGGKRALGVTRICART